MATKADIVLRVIDQATKRLKEIAAGVRGVAAEEKGVSTETAALRSQWANLVSGLREAGASFQEIAETTGLTREEFIQLGYTVEELTGLVQKQGVEILRIPKYIMGYRGGWLNLIMTLGFGVSVFKVLHRTLEKLWEPLTASSQRVADFQKNLSIFLPDVQEYAKRAREAEKETFNWGELLRGTALEMTGLHEVLEVDRIREHELAVKAAFEAVKQLSEEGLAIAAERFQEQRQQILETSGSAEEYTRRLLELLGITPQLYQELDALTRATFENATAMEFAAQQAAKLRERFERIMGVVGVMADLQEEAGGYVRDLADVHDTFADRVADALFRAGQAWESFQFRMAQTITAFEFRMGQMQARFEHRMGSMAARVGAAAGAAAARLALNIESIKRDHYDRLEDMARKHQESLRRMLQRAPWYLQRTIREYQRRKKQLEARGDKEGLARLKASFLERIRAIDPIFAEELERLEELQRDERDVEEREFRQRMRRARARNAISRALAETQAAISLADAIFADEQQRRAAEFAQQQRLDAMKFAYGQQKEASTRAHAEALKDYGRALADRTREFGRWAKDELGNLFRWGQRHAEEYNRGFGEAGAPRPRLPTRPAGTAPPSHQKGLPYVPATMPVIVHTGEAILRKDQAAAWRGGEGGDIYIQFYGPVYMRTRQQVSELAHDISREIGRKVVVRRR